MILHCQVLHFLNGYDDHWIAHRIPIIIRTTAIMKAAKNFGGDRNVPAVNAGFNFSIVAASSSSFAAAVCYYSLSLAVQESYPYSSCFES